MNSFGRESLGFLRSAYGRLFLRRDNPIRFDFTGQQASDLIRQSLISDLPCMICRFGSVELDAVLRYVDINTPHSLARKSLLYIRGQTGPFWWDERIKHKMQKNTGFFPATEEALDQFSQRMIDDIKRIDILASWQRQDVRLRNHFPEASIIKLHDLESWRHNDPWSFALSGKKVLVVHPFSRTITEQYKKRDKLFTNRNVLPDFELITLKAVQSIGGTKVPYV